MAARKIYDLATVTGQYTKDGQQKNRYKNVGSVLEMPDGGRMILLDRCFNPAGVPFKDGSDQIVLSMFAVKDGEQSGQGQATSKPAQQAGGVAEPDIPFARRHHDA